MIDKEYLKNFDNDFLYNVLKVLKKEIRRHEKNNKLKNYALNFFDIVNEILELRGEKK